LRGAKQSIARAVIASEAKQSIAPHKERMDCFAALAMTSKHTFAAGEDVGLMGERLRPTGNVSPSLRAKRSNPESGEARLDCFVAYAPRNDDCVAIGKAQAKIVPVSRDAA